MTNWFETMASGTRGRLLALVRRSARTINELARELGISDNAARTHVAALRRDGMVEEAGVLRGTGGKPAQLYRLTAGAEELFPKAYALVLGKVVRVLEEREGRERAEQLLREVGVRLAAEHRADGRDVASGVEAAATVLRSLGGDVEVERCEGGWRLRGYGCPLSGVTRDHAAVCGLAESLVEEIVGCPVRECCQRNGRPGCVFEITGLVD